MGNGRVQQEAVPATTHWLQESAGSTSLVENQNRNPQWCPGMVTVQAYLCFSPGRQIRFPVCLPGILLREFLEVPESQAAQWEDGDSSTCYAVLRMTTNQASGTRPLLNAWALVKLPLCCLLTAQNLCTQCSLHLRPSSSLTVAFLCIL